MRTVTTHCPCVEQQLSHISHCHTLEDKRPERLEIVLKRRGKNRTPMIAYTLSYYLHNYTLPILRTHVQACPPAAHIVFYFINAAYPHAVFNWLYQMSAMVVSFPYSPVSIQRCHQSQRWVRDFIADQVLKSV